MHNLVPKIYWLLRWKAAKIVLNGASCAAANVPVGARLWGGTRLHLFAPEWLAFNHVSLLLCAQKLNVIHLLVLLVLFHARNLSFLHYIGHPLHWLYQWNAAIGITNGDGDWWFTIQQIHQSGRLPGPYTAFHCVAFTQNICCCSKLSDALLLHFHKIVTQLWFSPSDCKNTESNTFTGNTGNTGWTRSIFLIHTPSFKTFTYKKRSSSKAKAEPRFLATEMHLHD